ncbi:uncharacterized protein ACN63O_017978 [Diretmus argenteus]
MAERAPWWRAFLVKRKSGGSKDMSQTLGPDFDPFVSQPGKSKDPVAASKIPTEQSPPQTQLEQSKSSNKPTVDHDDTYDDSQLESVFNEQTCRRNMRVSRSGRFKEKRKVRSSLPIEDKDTDKTAAGKEDLR